MKYVRVLRYVHFDLTVVRKIVERGRRGAAKLVQDQLLVGTGAGQNSPQDNRSSQALGWICIVYHQRVGGECVDIGVLVLQ